MDKNISEVIGIVADKGWGKTARMTYMLYQDHLDGAKIITNYSTEFSDLIATTEEIMEMIIDEDESLYGACIGLDELHQGADSRHFMSASNEVFNTFFSQVRKRNIILYYTVQFASQIDKRIRKLTNYVLNVSPDPLTYGVPDFKYEKNPTVFMWELRDPKSWMLLRRATWDATSFFELKLYDTAEIVTFKKNSKIKPKEKEDTQDDSTGENKTKPKRKTKSTKSKVQENESKE